MLAKSTLASMGVAVLDKHTRVGRARNNSFQRTACHTVQRKLGDARDMLLRPMCTFALRIPRRVINHTVASLGRHTNGFSSPRFNAKGNVSCTILRNAIPITAVRSCDDRMRTCAHKLKRLALRLSNCSIYRGDRRIVTRAKCSDRTSATGPAKSMFYTRNTKFVIP